MKKILTVVIICILSISTFAIYANNVLIRTNSDGPNLCYQTGNVEVRLVELDSSLNNGGYMGMTVSMHNKNDYNANVIIYATADGAKASREYQFVLDPKEKREEYLKFKSKI